MIVRGRWTKSGPKGKPFFWARVKLPNGHRAFVDLELDTASSQTILSESAFPEGMLASLGLPVRPVRTAMGRVPAYVVRHCDVQLYDPEGNQHVVRDLDTWFLKEIELDARQLKVFRQVFCSQFEERIQLPRNLLGRDILNRLFLLAHNPTRLLLTDEAPLVHRFIEENFRVGPKIIPP